MSTSDFTDLRIQHLPCPEAPERVRVTARLPAPDGRRVSQFGRNLGEALDLAVKHLGIPMEALVATTVEPPRDAQAVAYATQVSLGLVTPLEDNVSLQLTANTEHVAFSNPHVQHPVWLRALEVPADVQVRLLLAGVSGDAGAPGTGSYTGAHGYPEPLPTARRLGGRFLDIGQSWAVLLTSQITQSVTARLYFDVVNSLLCAQSREAATRAMLADAVIRLTR